MNARSRTFELSVEGRQVEEVSLSIFHTLLFYRSVGKFQYKREASYVVGSVGFEDVDCDFVDLSYVRCACPELDQNVRRDVTLFADKILNSEASHSGQISLEFYQKKKGVLSYECIPWEIWTLKLNLITLNIEQERQKYREKMGELLAEKIVYINDVMNSNEYVPKMPNQSDLELIFDTQYRDVQPYLFRIHSETNIAATYTVASTLKKLLDFPWG
ncbi:hypothetical protein CHUAL_011642 [Chamberlinius hualienensis]